MCPECARLKTTLMKLCGIHKPELIFASTDLVDALKDLVCQLQNAGLNDQLKLDQAYAAINKAETPLF